MGDGAGGSGWGRTRFILALTSELPKMADVSVVGASRGRSGLWSALEAVHLVMARGAKTAPLGDRPV